MTDRVHTTARRTAAVCVAILIAAVIPGIGALGHVARASAALPNGLVGYWPFNEGSGATSADLSGSGNTMTLGSTSGWTSTTAPVHAADLSNPSALSSAGDANSVATAPGNGIDNSNALTVAFWLRLSPTATSNETIVSSPGRFSIGYQQTGHVLGFARTFPTFTITIFANTNQVNFNDGNYHHVVMTVDPSQTVAYVDGVARNSIPGGFGQAGNGVRIGDAATPFGGSIDDLRIYNRALTSAQVSALAEVVPCADVTGIPVSECNALQTLYDNTAGFEWTHTDNWFATTTPCDWYGVFCDTDTGHVIALSLPDNGLVGTLPTGLSGLSHLVVLNLSGNQLSGTIPSDLGNLAPLQTLNVGRNRLTGTIPSSLGQLSTLHFLTLSNNALSGTIPSQLANLSAVTILDLSYNGLDASDPTLVAYLNAEEPDWAATQTVAPSNVSAVHVSPSSITVSWTPIPYTADGGYYDVLVQPASTGLFTSAGHTADKSANGFTITGLDPSESYVVSVRTFTPAHGNQANDILSVGSDPVAPTPPVMTSYTSNYGPDEYRYLYMDAIFFHRTTLADTQHDGAMFIAYLGGILESQGQPFVNLGNQPGTGPLAVTTAYDPADTTAIQHAAALFSSDPATIQHVGVDLVAYLLIISGHH